MPLYRLNDSMSLTLLEGEFSGVEYKYGGVSFSKDGDELIAKFDHVIMSDHVFDGETQKRFIDVIGEILMELIDEQSKDGSLVYHGGEGGEYIE